MTQALLQELSNSDIQWMNAKGEQQEIPKDKVLKLEENSADCFHILLDGTLSVALTPKSDDPLAKAFAALEGNDRSNLEITRLSHGEVVGENTLLGLKNKGVTIKTLEKCLLLSIPLTEFQLKSKQDRAFAARFYRAIAVLYLNRVEKMLERLGRKNFAQSQPVRDVLYIFGQLHDSDLDWAIANGIVQKVIAQTNLIRQGGPVDALYLLLEGKMTVFFESSGNNPLTSIFASIENKEKATETSGKAIALLQKGEIIGEAPFIDGRLPYATVQAKEDSLVLTLNRSLLMSKLQQDIGFAARFYQAISTLLAHKLQGVIGRLSTSRRTYTGGQSLSNIIEYEDELDENLLEQMSLAATRFDWMLKKLKGIA